MLIHRPGFPVVALFAQRLPVALIPKQRRIAPVRLDMIHNRWRRQFSWPLTLCAKRILYQESLSRLLPLTAIATLKGVRSIANMEFGMLVAVTIVRQSRATGMLARFLRSFRHSRLLLSYVRTRERMKDASGQRKKAWRSSPRLICFPGNYKYSAYKTKKQYTFSTLLKVIIFLLHYYLLGYAWTIWPFNSLPLFFLLNPPHCLKKNAVCVLRHNSCSSKTHFSSMGRLPAPDSPPTINQSIPFKLIIERDSNSGSADINLI